MFLSGVQTASLDSRLKHAGMTDFGMEINGQQRAAVDLMQRD